MPAGELSCLIVSRHMPHELACWHQPYHSISACTGQTAAIVPGSSLYDPVVNDVHLMVKSQIRLVHNLHISHQLRMQLTHACMCVLPCPMLRGVGASLCVSIHADTDMHAAVHELWRFSSGSHVPFYVLWVP